MMLPLEVSVPIPFGLSAGDSVLVVSAHPDDETLGMGGAIAALTAAGVSVDVLAVACLSGPMYGGVSDAAVRAAEFADACDALGVAGRRIAWTDTGQAAAPWLHVTELVTLIEAGPGPSLAVTRPVALFIPAGGHHQDHRAVHEAGLAATRPGGCESRPAPPIVAGYDGPEDRAWTGCGQRRPVVIDTTAAWPVKHKALECYASQLRLAPHPRSIEMIRAQDQATGAAIGTGAAEAFVPYRMSW
jgi:LmbE family N-acetylglucosaminyl deacetylase